MGKKYLVDTNVIIDLFENKLPANSAVFIKKLPIVMSAVSRVELMGRHNAGSQYLHIMKSFINDATVYNIDEPIILETIHIRQKYRIKLPDAIIAATAIVNKRILITHDIGDYKSITKLKVLDSWKIPHG